MRWRSRRYDPRYDPRYGYGPAPWGRPRYRSNGSCLRDACLLETGCCLGEALEDNCLMSTVLLLPRLALTTAPARAAGAMVAAIRLYQSEISAHRDPCCRFTPSCSGYAVEAIERHGALRGAVLAGRRLLRCRPGGRRGADPVPQRFPRGADRPTW